MMNDKSKLTAIILAGGKSTRMGSDKALIAVRGVPMLLLVYRIAEACAKKSLCSHSLERTLPTLATPKHPVC